MRIPAHSSISSIEHDTQKKIGSPVIEVSTTTSSANQADMMLLVSANSSVLMASVSASSTHTSDDGIHHDVEGFHTRNNPTGKGSDTQHRYNCTNEFVCEA